MITATFVEGDLHIEAGILTYGADMMLGIEYLKVCIGCNISSSNVTGTCNINNNSLRLVTEELRNDTLYVKNYLRNILLNAVARRDLVQNTVNSDAGSCITGDRREKHSTEGVTYCNTVTGYEGLNYEGSLSAVLGKIGNGNIKLLHFFHLTLPPVFCFLTS